MEKISKMIELIELVEQMKKEAERLLQTTKELLEIVEQWS